MTRYSLKLAGVLLLSAAGLAAQDRAKTAAPQDKNAAATVIPPAAEQRSVFAPTSQRPSPFQRVEPKSVAPGQVAVTPNQRIPLGDMLKKFIVPKGYMRGGELGVFINNRFYKAEDLLEVEVTQNPEQYEFPKAELVVKAVTAKSVDVFHAASNREHSISFNLEPEVTVEAPQGYVDGATIKFLGREVTKTLEDVLKAEPKKPVLPAFSFKGERFFAREGMFASDQSSLQVRDLGPAPKDVYSFFLEERDRLSKEAQDWHLPPTNSYAQPAIFVVKETEGGWETQFMRLRVKQGRLQQITWSSTQATRDAALAWGNGRQSEINLGLIP